MPGSLLGAQTRAGARLAEGRILRPSADTTAAPIPVAAQWVVLHRVGTDRAGPMDSMRTARNGSYRFGYTPSGDPSALYFVSARYAGIAYFSPPLRSDTVRGDDADIIVYDTTSDTTTLRLQGRHFVLSALRASGEGREVAEVFEIENSGTRTVVARDSVTPLWSLALPARAESVTVAPGDVTAGAVTFRPGRAELYAPVSPGIRQLVITYLLPASTTELALPMLRPVAVLEVLLEEPRARAVGGSLREVAPGTIDERQFRRFLAQDVPASAAVTITVSARTGRNRAAVAGLVIAVALLMLGALGVWYFRTRGAARPPRPARAAATAGVAPVSTSARLVAELATLDVRHEQGEKTAETRRQYEKKRAELKELLARALAEEDEPA